MIRRSTWITLAIFIILAVLAWVLLPKIITDDETIETTPTVQPTQSLLFNLTTQDISWVRFSSAEGATLEVERESASADWMLTGAVEGTSDSERISSIVGIVANMQVMRAFDVELGIETVGLDNPAYSITLRTFTGDEIVTNIGNLNQVGSAYYVQVDGEPSVLVAKLVMDEVLSVFTEPLLLATPTPEATETALPEVEITPTP